jgi:hypothetical protein
MISLIFSQWKTMSMNEPTEQKNPAYCVKQEPLRNPPIEKYEEEWIAQSYSNKKLSRLIGLFSFLAKWIISRLNITK